MKVVPVDQSIRQSPAFEAIRRAWPEIVFHDRISNEYWGRLYDERGEFQFALIENGVLLGEGNSVPVSGLPESWRAAFPNAFEGEAPDRLCAIAILIDPDHQGRGLSRVMLEHMRGLAYERGWELVAPVRPSLKLVRRVWLPGSPYGIALDPVRHRLWVTLTARNEVVELPAHGRPHPLRRFPTARQPDSVAVDPGTARVFVTGRTAGVLQLLDPRR